MSADTNLIKILNFDNETIADQPLETELGCIAQALCGLQTQIIMTSHLSQKRPSPTQRDGTKRPKRRRRREEIERKFSCPIGSCAKSYGTEGAVKTHVRLKHHIENSIQSPDSVFEMMENPQDQSSENLIHEKIDSNLREELQLD